MVDGRHHFVRFAEHVPEPLSKLSPKTLDREPTVRRHEEDNEERVYGSVEREEQESDATVRLRETKVISHREDRDHYREHDQDARQRDLELLRILRVSWNVISWDFSGNSTICFRYFLGCHVTSKSRSRREATLRPSSASAIINRFTLTRGYVLLVVNARILALTNILLRKILRNMWTFSPARVGAQ